MNPFSTLSTTFTDTQTYTTLVTKSFKASFGYFLLFQLLFSVFLAIASYFFILPQTLNLLSQNVTSMAQNLPDTAQITLSPSGLSTTNLPLPYTLPLLIADDAPLPFNNLLVIDTDATQKDFNSYQTVILITQDKLLIQNPNSQASPIPIYLSELPQTININSQIIQEQYQLLISYLEKTQPYLLWIIMLALFISLTLVRIVSTFTYGLLLFVMGYVSGRQLSYTGALKITLHTIVIAQILSFINLLFLPGSFPMFTVSLIGLNFIALHSINNNPNPQY